MSEPSKGITRRDLLKAGSLVGCGVFLASQLGNIGDLIERAEAGTRSPMEENELAKIANQLYSVCLQSNRGCGIKMKVLNDVAAKIYGNPFSPWTIHPHLPAQHPHAEVAGAEGAICPKGQAGIPAAYDPYRVRKVLKRAGKRGENKWTEIHLEQAVKEIVEGGLLLGARPRRGKPQGRRSEVRRT